MDYRNTGSKENVSSAIRFDGVSFNALVSLSDKEVAGKIWFSTPSNQIGNINLQTRQVQISTVQRMVFRKEGPARDISFMMKQQTSVMHSLAKYLIRFRPSVEPVVRNNNNIPIEQVAAPNTLLHYPTDTVEFPHKENNLSIRFTPINYNNTSSYHFYYRLNESTSWGAFGGTCVPSI